jgi:uroporphyrinogen III methyltransferase/synthase
MKQHGIVYLIGAGPGDAGLFTLKGAECLRRAEVVVYDYLVNPELLKLAPDGAEIIYAGKSGKQHTMSQNDINALLVKKGRAGKRVVRLKGGDPYVFGRGGEEAEELVKAGVPFEEVPGISSSIAAPAYAGIPVTHRECTSSMTIMTGHEDPTKPDSAIDWASLAKLNTTRIILMGVGQITHITKSLMDHGCPEDTPVAMIRWGTTARQQTITGTLGTIAKIAAERKFEAPAVTVIGDVVKMREELNWFEKKPLFHRRVVVTRSRKQASVLSQRLGELGADVLELPTIRIEPTKDKTLREVIEDIGSYDWVVFTSPNGVEHFFDAFFCVYKDIRAVGQARIAAIGPATAEKIKELHLEVELQPKEFVSEAVLKEFQAQGSVENLKFLLPRADIATDTLPKGLTALGAIVDDVETYRTVPETNDPSGVLGRLQKEGADFITFTSSSTVEYFCKLLDVPKLRKDFPHLKIASIGPVTSETAKRLGLPVDVEAKEHTIPGLAEAILNASKTA